MRKGILLAADAAGIVEAVEQVRKRDDVARDAGRVVSLRRRDDLIGIGRNVAQQLDFLGLIEKRQLLVRAGAQRQALARELLEDVYKRQVQG